MAVVNDPDVTVKGLRDFVAAAKQFDKGLGRVMGKANKKAAEMMADVISADAKGGTKQQAKAAGTVRAVADQYRSKVRIGGAAVPFAAGAFMGARERFGWYAAAKFAGSKGRQFLAWVGNGWDPGESLETGHAPGQPYVIGAAIHRKRDEFMGAYGDILEEALRAHCFNE